MTDKPSENEQTIAWQAYQCLGVLLLGKDNVKPTEAEQVRALDYFSEIANEDHGPLEDFLPWPREYTEGSK